MKKPKLKKACLLAFLVAAALFFCTMAMNFFCLSEYLVAESSSGSESYKTVLETLPLGKHLLDSLDHVVSNVAQSAHRNSDLNRPDKQGTVLYFIVCLYWIFVVLAAVKAILAILVSVVAYSVYKHLRKGITTKCFNPTLLNDKFFKTLIELEEKKLASDALFKFEVVSKKQSTHDFETIIVQLNKLDIVCQNMASSLTVKMTVNDESLKDLEESLAPHH